jgi:hypothetical protein
VRLLAAGATPTDAHDFLVTLLDPNALTFAWFDGLANAKHRFGAACTADRFDVWRRHRDKRRAAASKSQRVSPAASAVFDPFSPEAFAELERAREKGTRA